MAADARHAHILTFGRPDSRYLDNLQPARDKSGYPARLFTPRTSEPVDSAHLSDKRVGQGRLFGFPSQLFNRPMTDADP
ncbi:MULTISPECIES: hypothetical protein [unclassified Bradyrhizobium]|uniref:hypothetical protein n=1 Tax=Bradyrhizobium TaxID=374 RepID=UPI0028E2916E|nr:MULTISPECIES: hypothetical protein [unclassified Bradyrhizobium]